MPSWRTGPRRVSLFSSIAVPGEVCLSGSLDLFETSESDATPHIGDGLHWPDVRGWLRPREANAHKHQAGMVAVVAGSRGKVGAARSITSRSPSTHAMSWRP